MITCLFAPYKLSQWETATNSFTIDPIWYEQLLRQHWSNIKIFPEDIYLLSWDTSEITRTDEGTPEVINGFHGGLAKDRQIISIKPTSLEQVAFNDLYDFICWHRSIIPAEAKIFFTYTAIDAWSKKNLEITSNTTQKEVLDFLSPNWKPT